MRCLFGWNNPCRCLFRQRRAKCIMPKKTRYGVWRPDMNVINVSRCSMKQPCRDIPTGRTGRRGGGRTEKVYGAPGLANATSRLSRKRMPFVLPWYIRSEKEWEMELRATFGNVFRKEKHCSVRPCMPRRMLVAMQMEEFMTRRYDLRFNRMKGCKEYRERHSLFIDYRR